MEVHPSRGTHHSLGVSAGERNHPTPSLKNIGLARFSMTENNRTIVMSGRVGAPFTFTLDIVFAVYLRGAEILLMWSPSRRVLRILVLGRGYEAPRRKRFGRGPQLVVAHLRSSTVREILIPREQPFYHGMSRTWHVAQHQRLDPLCKTLLEPQSRFWGQTSQTPSSLTQKRGCDPERLNRLLL